MRNSSFEYDGWHKEAAGRYIAVRADLKVDIQTAEITWRRDELKPVPDSMSQFTDFESVGIIIMFMFVTHSHDFVSFFQKKPFIVDWSVAVPIVIGSIWSEQLMTFKSGTNINPWTRELGAQR